MKWFRVNDQKRTGLCPTENAEFLDLLGLKARSISRNVLLLQIQPKIYMLFNVVLEKDALTDINFWVLSENHHLLRTIFRWKSSEHDLTSFFYLTIWQGRNPSHGRNILGMTPARLPAWHTRASQPAGLGVVKITETTDPVAPISSLTLQRKFTYIQKASG